MQSVMVEANIRMDHPDVEIETVIIKTTGDQITDRPLYEEGGKGLFIKELELALRENRIDFAVHSCKDMPVTMPLVDESELVIGGISMREEVRDVLVCEKAAKIDDLPEGATVAVGSLRRKCQLMDRRSDLRFVGLRGNIDTRIKKLRAGEFDATILALAGVLRAALMDPSIMFSIPVEVMLPAPGQGAIALQCRKNDSQTRKILESCNDPRQRAEVEAERAVVAAMHCDCHSPIGVYARIDNIGTSMEIRAILGGPDGQLPIKRAQVSGDAANPAEIISRIVHQLS
jgi:hydroxymethylbilane synthase